MSEITKSPKLKNSKRLLKKRKKNSKREKDSGVAKKLKISEEFSESDREWASLPLDVSFLIQDKLFEVVDCLCFAATCKEWWSLSKEYDKATQHLGKEAMGKVLPLLLEYEVPKYYGVNLKAHNVSEEKRYNKLKWSLNEYGNRSVRCLPTVYWHHDFPPRVWPGVWPGVWGLKNRFCRSSHGWSLQNKWCGGSSQGWLVVVDLVDDVCFNITLVHPFNKSMAPICLPPLDFMTKPHLGRKRDVPELVRFTQIYPEYLSKVILSGRRPSSNPQHCFDVIAICDRGKQLAFLKLGGQEEEIKEWVYVEVDHKTVLKDVVFYRNKVYAVAFSGKIISFDVSRCKLQKGKILAPAFENVLIEGGRSSVIGEYLVKSSERDHLWHVRRIVFYPKRYWIKAEEERFEVYKVMMDNKDGSIVERVEVKSIGNEALFVGDCSHSVSVLASNLAGCKSNSIYYKVDNGRVYYQDHQDHGKSYQIFSLEDQTVKQMKSNYYKGVWVLPTFN